MVTEELPTFTTSRLILRELEVEDGPALQAYQGLPAHWCRQAAEPIEYADGKRIQRYFEYRGEGDRRRLYAFVAQNSLNGQLIGEIGIARTFPETFAIGFSVDPQFWGNGFATEMAHCALMFCFRDLDAHRITASVAVENVASCCVLEKIGMAREGTSRECIKAQGRWWDEHQYAIIASDKRN